METLKYNIVTLGNGNKYFVYDEYEKDNNVYNLILNVEEDSDIEIVKQIECDSKIILEEVDSENLENELKDIFKDRYNKEII